MPESTIVRCASCGKRLRVKASVNLETAACPKCKTPLMAPKPMAWTQDPAKEPELPPEPPKVAEPSLSSTVVNAAFGNLTATPLPPAPPLVPPSRYPLLDALIDSRYMWFAMSLAFTFCMSLIIGLAMTKGGPLQNQFVNAEAAPVIILMATMPTVTVVGLLAICALEFAKAVIDIANNTHSMRRPGDEPPQNIEIL